MNQRTQILAESIIDELNVDGREDILALALLRSNRRNTEITLRLRLSAVKATLENLIQSKKRQVKYGEKETRLCRA